MLAESAPTCWEKEETGKDELPISGRLSHEKG
jgi:hypothetical protein